MRIGILQFATQVGGIDGNRKKAEDVLSKADPKDLDLLVLPEMAFSGYNFKSVAHITPYLEPTASGITTEWARTMALKHNCIVSVGYPEKASTGPEPTYYNSAIVVQRDGGTITNYRKSFLYYTDETWASEGGGFFNGEIPGLGTVAMGICMDIRSPYKFEAPWSAWEFAYHILHKQANLVILSMAWLTNEDAASFVCSPSLPDLDTISYWIARLEPVLRTKDVGEIIVVMANRCGIEGDAVYVGTSCVLGINEGNVVVYSVLGRCDQELLVADTGMKPKAKIVLEPDPDTSSATNATRDTYKNKDVPAAYPRRRPVKLSTL